MWANLHSSILVALNMQSILKTTNSDHTLICHNSSRCHCKATQQKDSARCHCKTTQQKDSAPTMKVCSSTKALAIAYTWI